jgi:hypothetical protein
MTTNKQRITFISYSRVNKDFALKLARELKSEGFPIWLDLLDIPAGARWDDEIEWALHECGIFMVILTPASIASENAKDEIGYAIDHGKRILPILLEECEIPLRLRRFQYVDFTKMHFNEGVRYAKELLGRLIRGDSIPTPGGPGVVSSAESAASIKGRDKLAQPSKRKSSQSTLDDKKITQPEMVKGSKRPLTIRLVVVAAVILILVVPIMIARSGLLSGVPTAEDLPSTSTQTREIKPTNTATFTVVVDTPTIEIQEYYVEEFDNGIDWQFYVKEGDESDFGWGISNGRLAVTIEPKNNTPWGYLINNAFTYVDVKLDMVVVNNGNNSNGVSLICRYSDAGWYEFRASSNGNFSIYAFGPGGRILNEGYEISNRGSTAIKTGRETNVYTAICNGNELSFEINSVPQGTVTAKYGFPAGNIGIGFSAPENLPVEVVFKSVKVSQP